MPSRPTTPLPTADLKEYIKKHEVEPLLVEALKAAVDADSDDPAQHIGQFMLKRSFSKRNGAHKGEADGASSDSARSYMATGALGLARSRTAWLLFFLCGLLLCASVMHEFEALLARELELAFFVPLLIGHGGNSGGQVVSTVIRALGSGTAKLADAPTVIRKEATAGVLQSLVLVCALAPALHLGMGISFRVTCVVTLALPCMGLLANTLGSTLPFLITYLGRDPAVIVGPLMTTSVDSLGLLLYLFIATRMLALLPDEIAPECTRVGWGCSPANAVTASCKRVRGECVGVAF